MTDAEIRWSRKQDKINAEVQLDGIYVIRTSLQSSALGAPEAVEAYKSLAHVERAFRSLKTAQLAVRPIFVYSEDHVRGHILLCMLAYYVEWHLRRRLAPLLFEEEDRAGARALRQSPVEKAQVSASTKAKAASKQTPEGLPVHSFQTLLADLGTLTLNQVTLPDAPQHPFPMVAKPTPLQGRHSTCSGSIRANLLPVNWQVDSVYLSDIATIIRISEVKFRLNSGGNVGGIAPLVTPWIAGRTSWSVGLYFAVLVLYLGVGAWFLIDPTKSLGNPRVTATRKST